MQYPRTFELLDTVGATNKKTGKPVSRGKQVAYWQEKLDLIKRIVPQVLLVARQIQPARRLGCLRNRRRRPLPTPH